MWADRGEIGDAPDSRARFAKKRKQETGQMRLLLDTDIVIDMLRGYPPAMVWFHERPDDITLAISGFYHV